MTERNSSPNNGSASGKAGQMRWITYNACFRLAFIFVFFAFVIDLFVVPSAAELADRFPKHPIYITELQRNKLLELALFLSGIGSWLISILMGRDESLYDLIFLLLVVYFILFSNL